MTRLDKSKFDDRQLIELIYDRVDEIEAEIRSNYVKHGELEAVKAAFASEIRLIRKEAEPVRKIVYGLVSLALVTIGGAIISLVIAK